MSKTGYVGGYDGKPLIKKRYLTRSFDTLKEAQKFADSRKHLQDIFKKHGRYTVEWVKMIEIIQDCTKDVYETREV